MCCIFPHLTFQFVLCHIYILSAVYIGFVMCYLYYYYYDCYYYVSILCCRLAVSNNFTTAILGIRNPVHKQKLALKAMDVVLFGAPSKCQDLKNFLDSLKMLSSFLSVNDGKQLCACIGLGHWYMFLF